MKTVPITTLADAYVLLYEHEAPNTSAARASLESTLGNWYARYLVTPEKAIATQNWYGKVTRALFQALQIKQPRTKRDMLKVLA